MSTSFATTTIWESDDAEDHEVTCVRCSSPVDMEKGFPESNGARDRVYHISCWYLRDEPKTSTAPNAANSGHRRLSREPKDLG